MKPSCATLPILYSVLLEDMTLDVKSYFWCNWFDTCLIDIDLVMIDPVFGKEIKGNDVEGVLGINIAYIVTNFFNKY